MKPIQTSTRVALVAVLALLLRADSCSTTDRDVETPVRFVVEFDLDVVGNSAVADTVRTTADLAGPLLGALSSRVSASEPDTVYWVGMSAEFVRNDGFSTTRRLEILAGEAGSELSLCESSQDIPDNREGREALVAKDGGTPFEGEFELDLVPAGIAELYRLANAALDEYVITGDVAEQPISMVSLWDNDRDPGDPFDDFTLRVRLNFQVLDSRAVEVYAP